MNVFGSCYLIELLLVLIILMLFLCHVVLLFFKVVLKQVDSACLLCWYGGCLPLLIVE